MNLPALQTAEMIITYGIHGCKKFAKCLILNMFYQIDIESTCINLGRRILLIIKVNLRQLINTQFITMGFFLIELIGYFILS